MAERRPRLQRDVVALQQLQIRVERDLPERDDDATRAAARASSASRCGRQRAISSGVGLLSGGAQRTAAAMNASSQREPVVRRAASRDVGEAGAMERAIRKSPEPPTPSPVKTRPVRFAPCAAGARPTMSSRARGSPNPGTGLRPVRVVAERAPLFACRSAAQYVRSRGQRSQDTIRWRAIRVSSSRRVHRCQLAASSASLGQSRQFGLEPESRAEMQSARRARWLAIRVARALAYRSSRASRRACERNALRATYCLRKTRPSSTPSRRANGSIRSIMCCRAAARPKSRGCSAN